MDVQQVEVIVKYSPGRADTIAVHLAALACRVPALEDVVDLAWHLVVIAEPISLDQAPLARRWVLLVLALKDILADRFTDLAVGFHRVALRMQCLSLFAEIGTISPRRFDQVTLILLGDCRER